MNLLVTNTRNAQAYSIIRALRPYAEKIVVTMYGQNRLAARLSHAANSRLVDKRYHVPSPVEDWRAGIIQRENTPREEAYIKTVLAICERERIDVVFPSYDPHVYVFSKNKERFARLGVVIPIPDYETLITPLDKYRTITAASEAGFPCPKTYLPESDESLPRIADEIGFPIVIKPRLGSGSRGMEIATDLQELFEKYRLAGKNYDAPMIQEFIPGKLNQNIYLTLDQRGDMKSVFCPRTHHAFFRLYRNSAAACESCDPLPIAAEAARLAHKLQWWGGVTVQTKIDRRDGIPKLMEINPRLGTHLWYRTELGINEPLICLDIARGREVERYDNYQRDTMLLEPVEEAINIIVSLADLLIYKFRIGLLGKRPVDPANPPASLKAMLESFRECYLSGKNKVFNPYFRYFFQDPLVAGLWWLAYLRYVARVSRHLGR